MPLKSLEHIIDDKLKVLFCNSLPKSTQCKNFGESQANTEDDEVANLKFARPDLSFLGQEIDLVLNYPGMFALTKKTVSGSEEESQKQQ